MKNIFITGGTGYMGSRLTRRLLKKGYRVHALVRRGSESRLPEGARAVTGNPFEPLSFRDQIPPESVFIQLLGVAHPSPKKKELFRTIDLASVKSSARAAKEAHVRHFIYVSVAQTPTKVMQDYQRCRAEGESAIIQEGLAATFIRPWYVVGPGHYWPLIFHPLFKVLEWIPSTAEKAKKLKLVYLNQMLSVLEQAVEASPPDGIRIIEIETIRKTWPDA